MKGEKPMNTGKNMIYVRGRHHEIDGEYITFDDVVNLGYPNGKRGPLYEYDVTWKDGPRDKETGVLRDGESAKVIDGMKFDVGFTDKS